MKLRILSLLMALSLLLTACADKNTSSSQPSGSSSQSSTQPRDPSKSYDYTTYDVDLPSRSTTIPATLTLPDGDEAERFPLVVMNHDFGSDREQNGAFTLLAEELARRGIASIRMDFTGMGESTELLRKANLFDMKTDCMAALEYALAEAPIDPAFTGVLGYGFGGRVAIECASSLESRYQAMALLAPSADTGMEYMLHLFGGETAYRALHEQAFSQNRYATFTDPDGVEWELGDLWFDDLLRSTPLERLPYFTGDLLVMYGEEDTVIPPQVSKVALETAKETARIVSEFTLPSVGHDLGFPAKGDGDEEIQRQVISGVADFFDQKMQ